MSPKIGITLAALLVSACTSMESGEVEQGVVGGTVSPGDHAVVALVAQEMQFCTATLVADNVAITAAHCLPPNSPYTESEIEVFFGADLSQGGERIAVKRALAHPEWRGNALGDDIGMIELARPASIEPVAISGSDASEFVGSPLRVVGYGVTSDGGTENGVKRAGQMLATEVDGPSLYMEQITALTCNGDSGGPVFATTPGGEVLVGVHSRSDCTQTSLAERADVHLSGFISDFMIEAGADARCSADGLCASGCGEPDPDCGRVDASCAEDGTCDGGVTGGCSAASGGRSPWHWALVIALLGAGRRRSKLDRGGTT